MDTNKIIKEMEQIKDLRTRQARKIKENFLALIGVAKEVLEQTDYEEYNLITLREWSQDCCYDTIGDEKLIVRYEKDTGIFLENMECVRGKCEPYYWEEGRGWKFEEEIEKGIDSISTSMAFLFFKSLEEEIEKIVEKQRKFLEEQRKLLEL